MSDHLETQGNEILGKTIKGIVRMIGVGPRVQLFIIFSDDSYCEFWSDDDIRFTGPFLKWEKEIVVKEDEHHQKDYEIFLNPAQQAVANIPAINQEVIHMKKFPFLQKLVLLIVAGSFFLGALYFAYGPYKYVKSGSTIFRVHRLTGKTEKKGWINGGNTDAWVPVYDAQ